MRPEMIESWEKGTTVTGNDAEKWQMELWCKLQEDDWAGEHRGLLFKRVSAKLQTCVAEKISLPRRVSVFGLNTMPPVFLEFLNDLSRHSDVHLFLLSPCRQYWGDAASGRTDLLRRLRTPTGAVSAFDEEPVHPLLACLGQQGRDFQKIMIERVDFQLEFESYEDPQAGGKKGLLLEKVQSDLLYGQVELKKEDTDFNQDVSIRINSCHSAYREIAVLKDYLLHLLHTDHSLQLRDIIVMAPDIEQYASFIPAVFHDIQHSIADFSLQRNNQYISAFADFLKLFRGSFGWVQVLDLLRQPVVFPAFGLVSADLEWLEQRVIDGGIRRGLDGTDSRGKGGEVSWRAGLERFLMGYCTLTTEIVDGILPFADIEGSNGSILGALCEFVDLLEECRTLFDQEHSLVRWSQILLETVEKLFGPGDQRDYLELFSLLVQLGAEYGRYHDSPVSFEVILAWFTGVIRESRSSSGFLRGQLTFCSMLPMRSVPFRVICLLGLNDGDFPRMDRQPAFDLMTEQFRAGDRSVRVDDRYQFLEALLAARSSLYLSFVGQSIRTNERIPPSVVVSELLELLERDYGVENMVTEHPLHPFSIRYFQKDGEKKLFSYDSHAFRIASNLNTAAHFSSPWWRGSVDEEITRIDFSDLLLFYRNPQRWFLNSTLEIRLDEERELIEEREIFQVEGLGQYKVEQMFVEYLLSGDENGLLEQKLRSAGLWPLGVPGSLKYRQKVTEVKDFIKMISSVGMGRPLENRLFELRVGTYTLTGNMANRYEGGLLLFRYAKMKGKDLLSSWLHHLVANRLYSKISTILVTTDQIVRFSHDGTGPELEKLLDIFVAGCHRPSRFFIEPALVYSRQMLADRARISPLDKAEQEIKKALDKGYEPAWEQLFGREGEMILDDEFEGFCHDIMVPLLEGGTNG
jgi:exodeoxyribonuclease V gamma subunit